MENTPVDSVRNFHFHHHRVDGGHSCNKLLHEYRLRISFRELLPSLHRMASPPGEANGPYDEGKESNGASEQTSPSWAIPTPIHELLILADSVASIEQN